MISIFGCKSFKCATLLLSVLFFVPGAYSAERHDNQERPNVNEEKTRDYTTYHFYRRISGQGVDTRYVHGIVTTTYVEIFTPFIETVRTGNVEEVRRMLTEEGADATKKTKWHLNSVIFQDHYVEYKYYCTPIGEACKKAYDFEQHQYKRLTEFPQYSFYLVLQLLLEHGGDPDQDCLYDINCYRADVCKPMQICVDKGNLYHIKLLLDFGADVNAGLGRAIFCYPDHFRYPPHPLSHAYSSCFGDKKPGESDSRFLDASEECISSCHMRTCIYLLLRGANTSMAFFDKNRAEIKEFNRNFKEFIKDLFREKPVVLDFIIEHAGKKDSDNGEPGKTIFTDKRAKYIFWNAFVSLNKKTDIRSILVQYVCVNNDINEGLDMPIHKHDPNLFSEYRNQSENLVIANFFEIYPTNFSEEYRNLHRKIFGLDKTNRAGVSRILKKLFEIKIEQKSVSSQTIDGLKNELFSEMLPGAMSPPIENPDRIIRLLREYSEDLLIYINDQMIDEVNEHMGVFLFMHPDVFQVLTNEANTENFIPQKF